LRAVSDNTVVMIAEGLAQAHFQYGSEPLPTTAAPRMAKFCADETGAVKVNVNSNGDIYSGGQIYYDDLGGGRVIRGKIAVMNGGDWDVSGYGAPSAPSGSDGKKLLADVKFDAYDTSGKLVPRVEALKRLRAGGLVLLAGDNRFPDADYLKAFRDDILVLVSGEFVFPQGIQNPYDMATKQAALPKTPGVGLAAPAVPLPAVQLVQPQVVQMKAVQQAAAAAKVEKNAAAKEAAAKEAAAKEAAAKAAAEKAAKPAVPIKP
jgi:hypothetical protein